MAFCVCWWCRLATGVRCTARACCDATGCLKGCGRRAESGGPAPGLPLGRYRRGTGAACAAALVRCYAPNFAVGRALHDRATSPVWPRAKSACKICALQATGVTADSVRASPAGALLPTSFTSHASDHRPSLIGMWSLPACGNLRDSLAALGSVDLWTTPLAKVVRALIEMPLIALGVLRRLKACFSVHRVGYDV